MLLDGESDACQLQPTQLPALISSASLAAFCSRKGDRSTPVTRNPPLASATACRPGPQARSSAFPSPMPATSRIPLASSSATSNLRSENMNGYSIFQKLSSSNHCGIRLLRFFLELLCCANMPFSELLLVSPQTERASLFGEALEVATGSSSYILPDNGSICTSVNDANRAEACECPHSGVHLNCSAVV